MKHKKCAGILIVALLTASLLTSTAFAFGGYGTQGEPYIVDGTSLSNVSSSGSYVALGDREKAVSYTPAGSYVQGSLNGNTFNITSLTVGTGQYVTLQTKLNGTTDVKGGTLNVSSNGNKINGATGAVLNVDAGVTGTTVEGVFKFISGTVKLKDFTTISGGTPFVNGGANANDLKELTINGGNVSVSGYFSTVKVGQGATLTVTGDTYISSLTNDGTVSVNNGTTLCVSGASVKPNSGATTFSSGNTWGNLPGGTYTSVTGSWTLAGDVTVNATSCTVDASATSAEITANGKSLTVGGGTVALTGNVGALNVTGGAVTASSTLNAASVSVSGGSLSVTGAATVSGALNVTGGTVTASSTLNAASVSVSGSGTKLSVTGAATVTDAIRVESGTVTFSDTVGAKTLTVVSGTVTAANTATISTATEVSGGSLSCFGGVGALSLTGGKISLKASTKLADSARAITPGSAIDLTEWGVLPACTAALNGAWTLPSGITVTATADTAAAITGAGGTLTVGSNGVSVSGSFAALTVNSDFAAAVTNNTAVTGATTGKISIAAGKTVCDNDRSVCPSADMAASAWGTVPASTTVSSFTGTWDVEAGVIISDTAAYNCGAHTHTASATISTGAGDLTIYDGTVSLGAAAGDAKNIQGTVYVYGGTVTNTNGHNAVEQTGGVIVGEGSTTLAAGDNPSMIRGTFLWVTGTKITLAGDTTIKGTNSSTATVTGGGHKLTGLGGEILVKGSFSALATDTATRHVTLAGDTVIDDTVIGEANQLGVIAPAGNAYALTVKGGTVHLQGELRQLTVNGGTVTDCEHGSSKPNVTIKNSDVCLAVTGGKVTLDNGGTIEARSSSAVTAVNVTGGKLTFGTGKNRTVGNTYNIIAATDSAAGGYIGINISNGGECFLLDGTVDVDGGNAYGVYVVGSGTKFHLGGESNASPYDSLNTPTLITRRAGSQGVYINAGGEAWLHAGEIDCQDSNSYGIKVQSGAGNTQGVCHVWGSDQYGASSVGDTALLYVHGAQQGVAAMWVLKDAKFDVRGRGILFEEPADHTAGQYALYIENGAVGASAYPLSGGTFNGKVRYSGNDISTLLPPNHYVRCDGAAAAYGSTDGTYGVRPWSMTAEADLLGTVTRMHPDIGEQAGKDDGLYQEYLGGWGTVYTVTDAEWELRQQMLTAGRSYQIPAGIVRTPNTVLLDANVYATNAAAYTPYWGMGKLQGDVNVKNAGHTLYLAGRTLEFTGKNSGGNTLASLTVEKNEYAATQTVNVTAEAALTVRDCVFGGAGTDVAADDHSGGYIGTGTVRNTLNAAAASAIYAKGTLNVVSAQVRATGNDMYGVYADGTVTIGRSSPEEGGENNDNRLIDIVAPSRAVYVKSGTATLNGGIAGDVTGATGQVGIENAGGTLYVKGGIVTGHTPAQTGVLTSAGTTYITGGCIYGAFANDGLNAGTSIGVTDGQTFLEIDQTHGIRKSGGSYIGWTTKTIPLSGDGAYQTAHWHHICNVLVEGGELYVGTLAESAETVTNRSRINNGLSCTGGKTVFYDGVVGGTALVEGAKLTSAGEGLFTTRFYVREGDFGALSVAGHEENNANAYYKLRNTSSLSDCVQLHGGRCGSISVTAAAAANAVASTADVIGFWSNAFDFNDDDTKDWTSFNHFAASSKATYNDAGYWVNAAGGVWDVNRSDSAYWGSASDESIYNANGGAGKCVVIHNGAAEFLRWATSGASAYDGVHGNTYKLRCNLRLGAGSVCAPYFQCGWGGMNAAPVQLGTGIHNLDTNNNGIFGIWSGGAESVKYLLSVPEGSTLNVTNSNTKTPAVHANLIRNFSAAYSGAITAAGTLKLDVAAGNEKTVTVKGGTVGVGLTGGTTTLNAGSIVGKGTDANGVYMTGGTLDVNGGKVLGWKYGVSSTAGIITVDDALVISGGKADTGAYETDTAESHAISSSGASLWVKNSIVWGYTTGVTYDGTGSVTLTDVTAANNVALANARTVGITGGTVTGDVSYDTGSGSVTLTNAAVTGNVTYDGTGTVTLNGTTVTGNIILTNAQSASISNETACVDLSYITGTGSVTLNNAAISGSVTLAEAQTVGITGGTVGANVSYSTGTGNVTLTNAAVTGNVTYGGSGTVTLNDAAVTGSVTLTNAQSASITGGTVGVNVGYSTGSGNVTLTNAAVTGDVTYGGSGTVTLNGTTVTGNITLTNAQSASISNGTTCANVSYSTGTGNVTLTNANVTGDVTYNGGGTVTLSGTTVGGDVSTDNEAAVLRVQSGTITGGVTLTKAQSAGISGGTITGGVSIPTDSAVSLTVSGSTTAIADITQVGAGSNVTVTGTPLMGVFSKSDGTTSLGGGIYTSITTSKASEKLNGIIITSVKDHASTETRAATGESIPVTQYVLENNENLTGQAYDDDGSEETEQVTYAAPFILIYTAPPVVSGGGGGAAPVSDKATVVVDGVEYDFGAGTTENGVTSVTPDTKKLNAQIASAATGGTVMVRIEKSADADTVAATLSLKSVETMAQKAMTPAVQAGSVSYELPAAAIDTKALVSELGAADTAEVSLSIAIKELPTTAVTLSSGTLVGQPIQFSVTAACGGKTTEVKTFESYVRRVIELTAQQAARVTTAVVLENGVQRPVPTRVYQKDGKWYAEISSLTNSTYALISNQVSFTDAAGKWFAPMVTELAGRGIISGRSNGIFDGEAGVTRAEFAAIVVKALGLPADGDASKFADVPRGAWYAGAVGKAYEYGLVSGDETGRFTPETGITRQEAMVIVRGAAALTGFAGTSGTLDGFPDVASIDAWALDAARWNVGSGLIQGDEAGRLCGQDKITRGEAATVILRLLQKSGLV